MSLTRAQWQEMWEHTNNIQNNAEFVFRHSSSTRIKNKARLTLVEVNNIKELIQEVIGQME